MKNTFHTTERWHSFSSEVYPTRIRHQVVFHRLFYTQGTTGWIILVFSEVPGEKGYSQAGEDGGPWAHPQHDLAIHHEKHFNGTFYSYY